MQLLTFSWLAANSMHLVSVESWLFHFHRGHDVFNALDIFDNEKFLKELKFGIGDGRLRYYLYNWRLARELKPQQVGLVLL